MKSNSRKFVDFDSESSPEEFFDFSEKNNNGGSYITELYEAGSLSNADDNEGEVCQALRSVSHWAIGCKESSV